MPVEWINSLEDFFYYHNMEDPQHVTFIKMKPKGPARICWQDIENENVVFDYKYSFGHPPITQWTYMHKQLEDKHQHKTTVKRKPTKYTQGTLSVFEHTKKLTAPFSMQNEYG